MDGLWMELQGFSPAKADLKVCSYDREDNV